MMVSLSSKAATGKDFIAPRWRLLNMRCRSKDKFRLVLIAAVVFAGLLSITMMLKIIHLTLDDESEQMYASSFESPPIIGNRSSPRTHHNKVSTRMEQHVRRNNFTQTVDMSSSPTPTSSRACVILEDRNASEIPLDQISLIFPKPSHDSYDISAIYSRQAWLKLRDKLATSSLSTSSSSSSSPFNHSNNKTVMVVSGGSVSAGGFNIPFRNRYHQLFARDYPTITTVDRAHGARNSLHSANAMHTFFPIQSDIVIWEFSLNDIHSHLNNVTVAFHEARNQFILWLEQLVRVTRERQQKEPPLVILVYLWNCGQFDTPGSRNSDIYGYRHKNFVFESHQAVAEKFDFVVGHVNAGTYFESLNCHPKDRPSFLRDGCHPLYLAHQVMHYLLQDLVTDQLRRERPRRLLTTNNHHYPKQNLNNGYSSFSWQCGDETFPKRLMRHVVEHRYPVASYAVEVPRNDEILPGMLLPTVGHGELQVLNVGKSSALRSDRKFSVTIPCCGTDLMSFENITQYGSLQALVINILPFNAVGLSVFLDDIDVTETIIHTKNETEWNCFASDFHQIFRHWVILEEDRNVSNIFMCNHQPSCRNATSTRKQEPLSVMSVTIYGGGKSKILPSIN